MAAAHQVAPAVPLVEAADHRDAARARRPDDKAGAAGAFVDLRVRAHPFVGAVVRALGQQVEVGVADQRRKAVGVVDHHRLERTALGVGPTDAQPVGEGIAPPRHRTGEQRAALLACQRAQPPAQRVEQIDLGRTGQQRAHHQRGAGVMHAEHRERIAVVGAHQRVQRRGIDPAGLGHGSRRSGHRLGFLLRGSGWSRGRGRSGGLAGHGARRKR